MCVHVLLPLGDHAQHKYYLVVLAGTGEGWVQARHELVMATMRVRVQLYTISVSQFCKNKKHANDK